MRANLLVAGIVILVLASTTSATGPGEATGYRRFDNFNKRTILAQFRHQPFNSAAVAAGSTLEDAQTSDPALERALESAGVQHVEAVFGDFPKSAIIHGRTVRLPDFSNCYVFVVPGADAVAPLVTQLRSHPSVIAAESNDLILEPASEPNDPFYSCNPETTQWWLTGSPVDSNIHINIGHAWMVADSLGNASTTIGLLDSGVWMDHPDIVDQCTGDDIMCCAPAPSEWACWDHGTGVFGVLAAAQANDKGIAGVARVDSVVSYAIDMCANDKVRYVQLVANAAASCDIITTSSTYPGGDKADSTWSHFIKRAITRAYKSGVPFVAASGNDPTTTIALPARFGLEVIGVGGSTKADAAVSNYAHGAGLDIVAPAEDIITTAYSRPATADPFYVIVAGTSLAAPMVAGTMGLMHRVNPELMPEDYLGIIASCAVDIAPAMYDTVSGWGRLNAGRAVANMFGKYALQFCMASGYDDSSSVPLGKAFLYDFGDSVLADSSEYFVRRVEMRRSVSWPSGIVYVDSVLAWGRQDGSSGLVDYIPKYLHDYENWRGWKRPLLYDVNTSYVETMGDDGATLVSYAYRVYSDAGAEIATVGVVAPDSVTFGYGVIGKYMHDFSGLVDADTTISGPIWVKGDIRIAAGATLTIEGGARLYIAPIDHHNLGEDSTSCEIIVRGGLDVQGGASNHVVIQSGAFTKGAGRWRGICVDDTSGTVTVRYLDVKHADIGFETLGGSVDVAHATVDSCGTGFRVRNAGGTIKDVVARNCTDKGFYAFADSGRMASAVFDSCFAHDNAYGFYFGVRSDSCRIRNKSRAESNSLQGIMCRSGMKIGPKVWCESNGQNGLFLMSAGSSAVLDGVKSISNSVMGCRCDSSSSPEVKNSYLSANYDNFSSKYNSQPVLGEVSSGRGQQNSILNATRYTIANFKSGWTLKAENCYWGPPDGGGLPVNIYGSVDLDPWLDTEPTFLWRLPAPRLGTWASVNYPNPFNPMTRIDFSVELDGARTRIRIYDVAGRLVRTLMDQAMHAGRHTAIWDGRNGERQSVASGLYFARIQIGTGFEKMQKMMLVR